jgi:cytochrome c oxidase subunit 4
MSESKTGTEAHDEHDEHDEHEGDVHAHVAPARLYWGIFIALIILTVLTVGLAGIHLGKANLAVAIVIASIKAALVCTFFMHLNHDNRFHAIILVSAVLFIGIFFVLVMNDTNYRHDHLVDSQSGGAVHLKSGDKAPGIWEAKEGAGHKAAGGEHH